MRSLRPFSTTITTARFCFRRMSNTNHVRSTAASGSQVYESKRAVHEYLLFHFGQQQDLMPYPFGPTDALEFPERCAAVCSSVTSGEGNRALDVGCSVGGSAFHLAKSFKSVVGVDFSQHFVDAANTLQQQGRMGYDMLQQGERFVSREAHVPADIDRSRVQFLQGDACSLDASLGKSCALRLCWPTVSDCRITCRPVRCDIGIESAVQTA